VTPVLIPSGPPVGAGLSSLGPVGYGGERETRADSPPARVFRFLSEAGRAALSLTLTSP
jgi:hypothetical protein